MIINVDQDVDEDWVLEVIGHDGHAYNVTQKPGDLVLYESHSIIHGRPFPLKGRYYANIFIHFAPLTAIEDGVASARDDLSGTLSEEETGFKIASVSDAAAYGDLAYLQDIAEKDPTLLFQKDENLWQPIHEAARSGNLATLEYLVAQGADINARTYYNQTVLDVALYFMKDETHPLIQKLRELGAASSGTINFEEEADALEDEEADALADELEDEEADALADEF
jgi:prolyl 4-hydroxylase